MLPPRHVHDIAPRQLVQKGGEAAVSGREREITPQQAIPQIPVILLALQGGVGVVLHPIGLTVAVGGEGEGQGQHLAIDRQPRLRASAMASRPSLGGDVHEVGAGTGARCASRTTCWKGQFFDQLGVDEMDVVPVPLASLLGQQVVVHDQLIVLAVDRQHPTVAGDLPHEILQAPGVDLADRRQARLSPFWRPDVGGKDFDAGEAC